MRLRFADITLDPVRGEVEVAGRAVPLPPRVFGTLRVLALRAGEVVTREELLAAVWPGAHVVPNSVAQAVGALRRALAGSRGGWRIEAVPGVGYRLVADVRTTAGMASRRAGWRTVAAAASVAAGVLVAAVWIAGPAGRGPAARDVEHDLRTATALASSRRASDLLQARSLFERAAAQSPSDARAFAGLAETHYLLGFYGVVDADRAGTAAIVAASRAIDLDPSLARPYAVRASVVLDRDWDLAASGRDFRRALLLGPDDSRTQLWSAWWCLAAGLMPEARAAVDRAVALDPFSPAPLTARATFAYLDGDLSTAEVESRRALQIHPDYFRAHLRLGLVLLAAGRYDEALAELETAHRLEPAVPETTSALAHAYAVTSRPARAEAMLLKGAGRLPPYDRAVVLAGLGRRAEAERALVEAREHRTLVAGLFAAEPRLASLHGRGAISALLGEARAPGFPPAWSRPGPVTPTHR